MIIFFYFLIVDVNTNAMTIVDPQSYYHHKTEGSEINPVLEKNILMNFRTFEKEGILLYAFDHFNNFVQLHFADTNVYFTFNSDRSVYQIHVEIAGMNFLYYLFSFFFQNDTNIPFIRNSFGHSLVFSFKKKMS